MLESLGCEEELNVHSSQFQRDRSLEVHGVVWEQLGKARRPGLVEKQGWGNESLGHTKLL